jgi:geranylgeranyl reductase family protein
LAIRAEVAIVGAGPAGLAAAIRLGQLGVRGVVLCDRYDFPRDKTCGSALSPKGIEVLKSLGVNDAVASEAYAIRGLRLVTPRMRELMLSGHTDVALVCSRRRLDHLLLLQAQTTESMFVPNFQASFLLQRNDRIVGVRSSDGREIHARYTIVADGAHSRFAVERDRRHLIQAIMGWWQGVVHAPNHIEMIFDSTLKPLYGWLFPESETLVNIGICYEDRNLNQNARGLFATFLQKHYHARLGAARQVGNWRGHPISYSIKVEKLTSPGRIVVGEAGRMTHPATAEGIYQGMRSGILAAETLASIFHAAESPSDALRRYEWNCRRAFGDSFRGALLWRWFVNIGGLDLLATTMNRSFVQQALAKVMAQM